MSMIDETCNQYIQPTVYASGTDCQRGGNGSVGALGEYVARRRAELRLSLRDLGKATGLAFTTVHNKSYAA